MIMNNLVKKYIDARAEAGRLAAKAREIETAAEEAAEAVPIPKKIRPAESKDIVEGAVIWYPEWFDEDGDSRCWNIVDEVLRPNDRFKAYNAHDGCRYGIDGAFVE
jgi:hypothetical protein